MYSVERLYALDDYCRDVSRARMIAVCVLTPLPALLLVVAQELIPLQDPNAGWRNNYGVWMRFGIISVTVGFGLSVQLKGMTVEISISTWKLIAVSLATSICHVAMTLAIGSVWVFPIPFCFVLTMPPFIVCLAIFSFMAVGHEAMNCAPLLARQLQVIISQCTIAIFYTGLSAVFSSLPSHGQIAFVALLPLIKLVFKHLVASASAFLEEYVSGIVVFSAELAHALFAAACMQTARSPLASVVIIAFDALSSVLSLRSINQSMRTIQRLLSRHSDRDGQNHQRRLMFTVLQICRNPQVFSSDAFAISNLRFRSPLPIRLSTASQHELAKISRHQKTNVSVNQGSLSSPALPRSISSDMLNRLKLRIGSLRIAPLMVALSSTRELSPTSIIAVAAVNSSANTATADAEETASIEEQTLLVRETAKLMFHCEYVVLIEYVECVIPMVYGLYLQAFCHLGGNARTYYPQTRDLTMDKLNAGVGNLIMYVWLEVLSLLALQVVLRRKFGFSILSQLAFVLETHANQVQGRLFVWTAFILTFTLQHFGADFSFRFEWMKDQES